MLIGNYGKQAPAGKGHTIKFHGTVLTLVPQASGLALMQYGKMMERSAAGLPFRLNEAAQLYDVLRSFFPDTEWEKFESIVASKGSDMDDMIRMVNEIVEVYSGTPPVPSSASPAGRRTTTTTPKSKLTPVSASTPTRRRSG